MNLFQHVHISPVIRDSMLNTVLENLQAGSYTGDCDSWMKESSRNGATLAEGAPWGELGGSAPLLGTPKDMLSRTLEMGVFP